MTRTEILTADATPALVTTRVLVPAAVAASNLATRRSAGMRAVAGHATDLEYAAAVAHAAAFGRMSAGPALALMGALPTDDEIDALIAGYSEGAL